MFIGSKYPTKEQYNFGKSVTGSHLVIDAVADIKQVPVGDCLRCKLSFLPRSFDDLRIVGTYGFASRVWVMPSSWRGHREAGMPLPVCAVLKSPTSQLQSTCQCVLCSNRLRPSCNPPASVCGAQITYFPAAIHLPILLIKTIRSWIPTPLLHSNHPVLNHSLLFSSCLLLIVTHTINSLEDVQRSRHTLAKQCFSFRRNIR